MCANIYPQPIHPFHKTTCAGGPIVDDEFFSTVSALNFDVCMISTRNKIYLLLRNIFDTPSWIFLNCETEKVAENVKNAFLT